MSYSSAQRNRSRIAVAVVSGATAIAAFSATGWLAGAAARATEAQQADPVQQDSAATGTKAAAARPDRHRPVVLKQRPHRTHVTVRYVRATPSAPVGGGGTVSQPAVHTPSAPAPHPAPQPAPQPPPAPSSGS